MEQKTSVESEDCEHQIVCMQVDLLKVSWPALDGVAI